MSSQEQLVELRQRRKLLQERFNAAGLAEQEEARLALHVITGSRRWLSSMLRTKIAEIGEAIYLAEGQEKINHILKDGE